MKVASYNIRKAVGRDRRRDPARILDVLNTLDADVVVLQEADRRLGQRPAALPPRMILDHSDFVPAPLAVNDVSLGWHGNAVLVKRGVEITGCTRIDLPFFEPRGAVAVEIEDHFRVVGVHLGLLRRHRHGQLRQLRSILSENAMPTAILGDFNEWSKLGGMEELGADFHLHLPGPSFPTLRPTAMLDRVALTHDIELRDKGVMATELTRIASDHLPVWVNLTLPGAAAPRAASAGG
ncbi:endonuclease/exonuclease/phosphatase family protein [uncultured Maritimibacter sp.]|jgi:endonuclease/exonuclease/phosphatase family metal-dependent hydrolase|uniref:endonuclease/exonuclease/phosphatase family protein n=1 Tax=uncultured Maritimibacter sp. TaxID=991866 RepID=UPI000A78F8EA|nr:endonuclease/exonuclease/phosphatase family protein [uncultured Maritimibacter sp.]